MKIKEIALLNFIFALFIAILLMVNIMPSQGTAVFLIIIMGLASGFLFGEKKEKKYLLTALVSALFFGVFFEIVPTFLFCLRDSCKLSDFQSSPDEWVLFFVLFFLTVLINFSGGVIAYFAKLLFQTEKLKKSKKI